MWFVSGTASSEAAAAVTCLDVCRLRSGSDRPDIAVGRRDGVVDVFGFVGDPDPDVAPTRLFRIVRLKGK